MLAKIARRYRTCLAGLAGALLIIIWAPSLMAEVMGELTGTVTDPAGAHSCLDEAGCCGTPGPVQCARSVS